LVAAQEGCQNYRNINNLWLSSCFGHGLFGKGTFGRYRPHPNKEEIKSNAASKYQSNESGSVAHRPLFLGSDHTYNTGTILGTARGSLYMEGFMTALAHRVRCTKHAQDQQFFSMLVRNVFQIGRVCLGPARYGAEGANNDETLSVPEVCAPGFKRGDRPGLDRMYVEHFYAGDIVTMHCLFKNRHGVLTKRTPAADIVQWTNSSPPILYTVGDPPTGPARTREQHDGCTHETPDVAKCKLDWIGRQPARRRVPFIVHQWNRDHQHRMKIWGTPPYRWCNSSKFISLIAPPADSSGIGTGLYYVTPPAHPGVSGRWFNPTGLTGDDGLYPVV